MIETAGCARTRRHVVDGNYLLCPRELRDTDDGDRGMTIAAIGEVGKTLSLPSRNLISDFSAYND